MQKARRHPTKGLRPLVSVWFQVYCTPLFKVLFTFPSRYQFTIGLSRVFSLTGWCRQIPTGRLRPRSTQDTTRYINYVVYGIITLFDRPFQTCSTIIYKSTLQSYNPSVAVTTLVWAVPRSLATTYGIIIYFLLLRLLRCFSSAGLLLILRWIICLQHTGLSHSEIQGYNEYLPLPLAYRSLSRPSSPPRSKASSMRPYLLSYVMLNAS